MEGAINAPIPFLILFGLILLTVFAVEVVPGSLMDHYSYLRFFGFIWR